MFDALCRWVECDHGNRAPCFAACFRHVRLPLMSRVCLADKVRTNRLVQSSLECRDWLDEVLISYHLIPERRPNIPLQHTRPRTPAVHMCAIYAIGGLSSVEGMQPSVERCVFLGFGGGGGGGKRRIQHILGSSNMGPCP